MECLINPKDFFVAVVRMSCGIVDDIPDSFAGEFGFKSRRGGRLLLPMVPLRKYRSNT
jgi:hypothetical protein